MSTSLMYHTQLIQSFKHKRYVYQGNKVGSSTLCATLRYAFTTREISVCLLKKRSVSFSYQ